VPHAASRARPASPAAPAGACQPGSRC